jgi:hypothetical protein
MAATNVQAFPGDVEIAGAISKGGQVLYPQKRWEIDLTSDTTTARFYPIYFASSSPASVGVYWPVNFKVFGESFATNNSFNEDTIIGYARGGGYSDHEGICKVHSHRHGAAEPRFQGIWKGGTTEQKGFVIYMRGGYKYSILTDASTVVENKAPYVSEGSTFAVKDVAGSDVVGTSANIVQMMDMNDFVQMGEVTATTGSFLLTTAASRIGIGTNNPGLRLETYTGNGAHYGLRLRRGAGAAFTDLGHLSTPGTEGLAFSVSDGANTTQEVMRVTGTGRVGIGTNAPGSRLAVLAPSAVMPSVYNTTYGTKSAAIMVSENEYNVQDSRAAAEHKSTLILSSDHVYNSGKNAGGSIGFAAKNEFGGYAVTYGQISAVRNSNFNGGLSFATMPSANGNLVESMRIAKNMVTVNVPSGGDGTATLEVYNDATAANAAGLVADFTGPWIRVGDARTARTFSSGTGIKFHDSGVANFSIGIKDSVLKIGQTSSDGSTLFPDAATDKEDTLCLTSAGNVGIGTINPGATASQSPKLDVRGSVSLTGGAHGSRPTNDGSVLANAELRGGPGTGSAGFLRLSAGGYNNGSASDPASKVFIDLCGYSGTADFTRNISFWTNNTERMRINNAGLIGIGTTAPVSKMHFYKSDFASPGNGNEYGSTSVHGIAFKSKIHSGGQNPAPSWYNSLAIDNFKMYFNPRSYGYVYNNQAGSHGTFNIGGGFINNSQSNTPTLTVTTNDKVGVNRERPAYNLDVNGSFRCTGAPADNSDRRIKKNIVDVNDASALETIRLIKPKRYDYLDTKSKDTEDTVWGFIAQEVREVLPYATDVITDFIPNIMTWANVVGSNVITINTTELLSNTGNILVRDIFNKRHEVVIDEVIDTNHLRVLEDLSGYTGSHDATGNIITETQTTTFTLEEYKALENATGYEPVIGSYTQTTTDDSGESQTTTLTVDEYNALEDTTGYESVISNYTKTEIVTPGSQIFVYGEEVNDFHVLKKDAIWTVATAALQEVDRQQQSDKTRITELETQITSVLSRLDALES